MSGAGGGAWREDVVYRYALLGVEEWRSNAGPAQKKAAESLGIDIADHAHVAGRAITDPFSPQAGGAFRMIPMPRLPRRVNSAFFAPTLSNGDAGFMAFDLVVIGQEGKPIAFRFEPADGGADNRHDYDHVQLSEKVAHRQVVVQGAMQPLPVSYPAFPLPSYDSTTRFLAMAVAMHGFPDGIQGVVQAAFKGRERLAKGCLDAVREMIGGRTPKP